MWGTAYLEWLQFNRKLNILAFVWKFWFHWETPLKLCFLHYERFVGFSVQNAVNPEREFLQRGTILAEIAFLVPFGTILAVRAEIPSFGFFRIFRLPFGSSSAFCQNWQFGNPLFCFGRNPIGWTLWVTLESCDTKARGNYEKARLGIEEWLREAWLRS